MTPKEKAKELADKFKGMVNPYVGSGMLSNTHDDQVILHQCKKCANVVVDEIESALVDYGRSSDELQNMDRELDYWDKVKIEIYKL